MITTTFRNLLVFFSLTFSWTALACSPCGALSNVTQTINGTNLELTFTSNAGWNCCYNVRIEIVCANANFTGVPNYLSDQVCIGGGGGASTTNPTPTPYPLTVIDLSSFCPGTYQWRADETGCGIYTPTYTFEVVGASPIVLNLAAASDSVCLTDNTQLTASASGGCNGSPLSYAWSPAAGLSNPNIANPIATPGTTTTYTCTVTESGSCTAPQTGDITITVNPLPTATITGTIELCQGAPPPDIVLSGSGATAPYTINYTLNGVPQTQVVTSGSATVSASTSTPGTYTYSLVDVSESSSTACTQNIVGTATVIINPLPVVEAGEDQEICEPNPTSPSEITLYGSGAITYSWDNGAENGVPFVPPIGVTTYTLTGIDGNGCSDTDFMTVTSYPLPTADGFADNVFGNLPVAVFFSNTSLNGDIYYWDFGDGTTMTTLNLAPVNHTYSEPGIYTVTLTASNGICFDVWTIQIEVLPPMEVVVPNVFTPNADGANDEYIVDVKYGAKFDALIVNRWGNEVTTLTHLGQGWNGMSNGTAVNEGVYYILWKAEDHEGKQLEGQSSFTLLR